MSTGMQKMIIPVWLRSHESIIVSEAIEPFKCLGLTSCICGQKKHQVIRVQAMLVTGGKL